ncbi:MAG: S41 family peptidase [Candidatus Aminicenantes bacterium]|nr:S41 family peptidase [Candidatus Aminicenantes bacterium]
MKIRISTLLLIVILAFFCFRPVWNEDVWTESYRKLAMMMDVIDQNYFKEVDREELTYASIKGMLRTLDPYSNFLDPKNLATMREDYQGKYFGLGIMIQKQDDRLMVISPIEGTPAYRLGIQPGDIISHIEGESTKTISSFEAMQKLRGEKDTQVNITIIREGMEGPLNFTIKREEIPLHSVPYAFMLTEDIGYIFIRNFAENTTDELEEKLEDLKAQGMQRLILDLRGNGGGTFIQSLEISDEFLYKEDLIVSIRGRNKLYNRELRAFYNDQYENIPLIILINQGSASASEIVSGAVKDNDRGLIIGDDSWGKGLVQTVFPLSQDAAVSLTTAKYYTPSGRSIQKDYSQIENFLLNRDVPEESREVAYTAGGRKVLGQGGIAPDYEVTFSYKNLTYNMLARGLFFSYARNFADKKTSLSKTFVFPESANRPLEDVSEGRKVFSFDLKIDPQILADFKSFLREKKFDFDEEDFNQSLDQIKRELQRELVSAVYSLDVGTKTYRLNDPVIEKALEVFPEAEDLVKAYKKKADPLK